MSLPTVYIVDDDPAIRDALTLMLEQDRLAVETFESAEAFLSARREAASGCIIIDVRMPGMDGMHLHSELDKRHYRLPVIFLSGHGDIPMSVRAIKAGAMDFLTKPVTREKLLASVHTALRAAKAMQEHAHKTEEIKALLAELTEREREVMALAVLGHTNKEIARRLAISHRTVEIHKARIMHKTGAVNVLDLARMAQAGELPPASAV